jgi:hypothetical protein
MAPGGEGKASGGGGAKGGGGGRKRKFLPHGKPVRKGAYPLRPGVQGFFITCDGGRERQATREALSLLDSVRPLPTTSASPVPVLGRRVVGRLVVSRLGSGAGDARTLGVSCMTRSRPVLLRAVLVAADSSACSLVAIMSTSHCLCFIRLLKIRRFVGRM